eukprot:gene2391-4642_t
MKTVSEIFQNSLYTQDHKSMISKLNKIYEEIKNEGQEEQLLNYILQGCIDRILIAKSKDSIDYGVEFIGKWLSTSSDLVLQKAVNHLLLRLSVADKTVRTRACYLLAKTLESLSKEKEVEGNIIESISSALLPRLRDKISTVRMWAVYALKRIQNPHDNNDPIIKDITFLMASDSSAEVRKASVETLAVSGHTLTDIISRVKDVKSSVRIACIYRLIDEKIDPRHLNRTHKVMLIQYGLQDRDKDVREIAKKLFSSWVTSMHFNIPKLLLQLGVDSVEGESLAQIILEIADDADTCQMELRQVVRDQRIDWTDTFENCALGEIFWTLMRCDYYRQKKSSVANESVLEALLPDTVHIARLLKEALVSLAADEESSQAQLKALMIFRLAFFVDQADEAGRMALAEVCHEMVEVVTLPTRLLEFVLTVWIRCGEDSNVIPTVLQLIQRLWTQAEDSCCKSENEEDHDEEEEEERFFGMRVRAAELMVWVLQHSLGSSAEEQTAVMCGLRPTIDSALQQPVPVLRALALHCIGLMGLLRCESKDEDGSAVYEYSRNISMQTVALEDEEVCIRSQALQTLVDMAVVRPDSVRQDPALVNILLRLLSDGRQDPSLLRTAAQASAKLLFNGVVTDPRLFAKLVIIFFQPKLTDFCLDKQGDDECEENSAEEEEGMIESARLQQLLNVFFRAFFRAGGGRVQVALAATVELVSDMSSMIRDGEVEAAAVVQVLDHLIRLCEDLLQHEASTGPMSDLDSPMAGEAPCDRARRAIQLRAVVSLFRELLKLGSGVMDRTLSKELMKILGSICAAPTDWITAANAEPLEDIISCTATRFSQDKAVMKTLDRLLVSCRAVKPTATTSTASDRTQSENDNSNCDITTNSSDSPRSEDVSFAVHSLYLLVPGLVDLVQLASDSGDSSRRYSGGKSGSIETIVVTKKVKKNAVAKAAPLTEITSPSASSPVPKKSRAAQRSNVQKRANAGRVVMEEAAEDRSPQCKRDRIASAIATPSRMSSRLATMSKAVEYKDISDNELEASEILLKTEISLRTENIFIPLCANKRQDYTTTTSDWCTKAFKEITDENERGRSTAKDNQSIQASRDQNALPQQSTIMPLPPLNLKQQQTSSSPASTVHIELQSRYASHFQLTLRSQFFFSNTLVTLLFDTATRRGESPLRPKKCKSALRLWNDRKSFCLCYTTSGAVAHEFLEYQSLAHSTLSM